MTENPFALTWRGKLVICAVALGWIAVVVIVAIAVWNFVDLML